MEVAAKMWSWFFAKIVTPALEKIADKSVNEKMKNPSAKEKTNYQKELDVFKNALVKEVVKKQAVEARLEQVESERGKERQMVLEVIKAEVNYVIDKTIERTISDVKKHYTLIPRTKVKTLNEVIMDGYHSNELEAKKPWDKPD